MITEEGNWQSLATLHRTYMYLLMSLIKHALSSETISQATAQLAILIALMIDEVIINRHDVY